MIKTRLVTALLIGAGAALVPFASAGTLALAQIQNQTGDQAPGAGQAAPVAKSRPAATGSTSAAAPKAAAKAAAKTPAEGATEPAKTDGAAQLRQRIEQLEEQINEMHVAVGTLDSFAKTGAGRASSATGSGAGGGALPGDAAARLDGMEGRLRSLSGQIEQMAQQIRTLESRAGEGRPGEGRGGEGRAGRSPQDRSDAAPAIGPPARAAEMRQPEPQAEAVERAGDRGNDGIGGLIRGPGSDRSADVGSAPLPPIGPPISGGATPRQQPASLTSGSPKEAYERAYGSLLRQDYASAEIGFAEFLTQFPNHELSGNAQYWLGESFYVRGQYRPAANAFLKGYQSYSKSQKAPDSLLKLGMALDKLGQRDAACSSIGELSTRFPTAPAHIQSRAQSERARLGC